jgi:hypothetical protein
MPSARVSKRTAFTIIFGVTALTLLVSVADALITRYVGNDTGEPCTKASDCKGVAAFCLEGKSGGARYCSHSCGGNLPCPTGWACGASGYKQVTMLNGEAMGSGHEVDVCWRDKPTPTHGH